MPRSVQPVRAAAFRASIPVFFGYLPLGAAFGLLFGTLGYPWPFAVLSGLVIFAGAAQYLSVGLLAAHAGLPAIFAATFFINMRHMFYGISLLRRFPRGGWRRAYMIFTLTDETYSVLTTHKNADRLHDEQFCLWVSGLNHGYWVFGCAVGALLGSRLHFDTKGLDFVLTALFVVLTVEKARAARSALPFLLAACAAAFALIFFPAQLLPVSLTLVFAVLFFTAERVEKAHA